MFGAVEFAAVIGTEQRETKVASYAVLTENCAARWSVLDEAAEACAFGELPSIRVVDDGCLDAERVKGAVELTHAGRYWIEYPPSTGMGWPVTYEASSELSQTTVAAISSG